MLVLLVGLAIYLRIQYGGGQEYPDVSTEPKYGSADLVEVIAYPDPIGNVAVSKDTIGPHRVFFTIHPESRPETIKLVEIINGKAEPYPSLAAQSLFSTVLGVFTDQQNRLWTIDHGNHGFEPVRLLAFDLSNNQLVHEYAFPKHVAKKGSFFNDLSVSPDGRHIVVANVSFFGRKPSIAVYDLQSGESRNRLEAHRSMKHEQYVPITPNKKMRFFGGLVDLLTGIDGIDFTRDGEYVYWAPMGHSKLFRIATTKLTNFDLSETALAEAVEEIATKPLSDGIRTDFEGNVYITDIENQGIYVVSPEGKGYTLIKDERIRWADGLSLAMDGTFYLADSDIPNQMLMSKKNMEAHSPYYIFKFSSLEVESK
ncbi:MAG: L-dopachrome tautomerase-related protein [Bacteroidota bacterium]